MTSFSSSSSSYYHTEWKYTILELSEVFSDLTPMTVDMEYNMNDDTTNDDTTNDDDDDTDKNEVLYGVSAIEYTERFRIAYGYFRTILVSSSSSSSLSGDTESELSHRTLRLTGTCLQINPANYTVWHFRRRCLASLYNNNNALPNTDNNNNNNNVNTSISSCCCYSDYISAIQYELNVVIPALGGENPKNYQIWYHRRALLESLLQLQQQQQQISSSSTVPPDILVPQSDNNLFLQCILLDVYSSRSNIEFDYINAVLFVDTKNYHAWSHRQYIVSKLMEIYTTAIAAAGRRHTMTPSSTSTATAIVSQQQQQSLLYNDEMMYCDNCITTDIRNNSAWNYRWYLFHKNATTTRHCDASSILPPNEMMVQQQQEIDYSIRIITIDPYNESPYKYLLAMVREYYGSDDAGNGGGGGGADCLVQDKAEESQSQLDSSHRTSRLTIIQNVIEQLRSVEQDHLLLFEQHQPPRRMDAVHGGDTIDITNNNSMESTHGRIPSIYLYSTLVELYTIGRTMLLESIYHDDDTDDNRNAAKEVMVTVETMDSKINDVLILLQQHDTIRSNYWQSRAQRGCVAGLLSK